MTYAKGCLAGLAALLLAGFVVMFMTVFKDMSQEKATGLAVLAGGLAESVFSPLF